MTIQDIREAQAKIKTLRGQVVSEFRLPKAEIDEIASSLQPLVGCDDENPPPVATIYGVSMVPNEFVRVVMFTDGSWALLKPGTLEWDKDKVFPPSLRPVHIMPLGGSV